MSSLALRALTSLFLVPLLIGSVYAGPVAFAGLLALTAILGARELIRIQESKGVRLPLWLVTATSVLMITSVGWGKPLEPTAAIAVSLVGCVVVLLGRRQTTMLSGLPAAVLGFLYLGLLPAHLLLFYRLGEPGVLDPFPVYFAVGSVWACDTLAYIVGSMMGRHKLWPRVSPSKSWEGAIGGCAGSVSFCCVAGGWVPGLDGAERVVSGVLAAVFGQLGDLAESMMKREASQKDSGHAIPGHGGVLDRLDSLVIAVPVLLYWVRWAAAR